MRRAPGSVVIECLRCRSNRGAASTRLNATTGYDSVAPPYDSASPTVRGHKAWTQFCDAPGIDHALFVRAREATHQCQLDLKGPMGWTCNLVWITNYYAREPSLRPAEREITFARGDRAHLGVHC